MPLKKGRGKGKDAEGKDGKKVLKTKGTIMCHFITPGPKYQLKTLVGYRNHCISRYRNPAYTFGCGRIFFKVTETPGPKYMIKEHRLEGFTFGDSSIRDIGFRPTISPGPKYKLPDIPRGPFFSIKWKTKLRKTDETPGPYYIKPTSDAPAFSMGLRTAVGKPAISGGPYAYSLAAVKPRAPMYTIVSRRAVQMVSEGPGPVYAIPPFKPTPAFSFGVKHSECAIPYVTECDLQC